MYCYIVHSMCLCFVTLDSLDLEVEAQIGFAILVSELVWRFVASESFKSTRHLSSRSVGFAFAINYRSSVRFAISLSDM